MPGISWATATSPAAVAPPWSKAYTSMPIQAAYSATMNATKATVRRATAGSLSSARVTRKNRPTLTSLRRPGPTVLA